jgi:hypothetical protein
MRHRYSPTGTLTFNRLRCFDLLGGCFCQTSQRTSAAIDSI